jgi:hypothetical protein
VRFRVEYKIFWASVQVRESVLSFRGRGGVRGSCINWPVCSEESCTSFAFDAPPQLGTDFFPSALSIVYRANLKLKTGHTLACAQSDAKDLESKIFYAVLNDRDLSPFSRPWQTGVGVCTRPWMQKILHLWLTTSARLDAWEWNNVKRRYV